MSSCFETAGVSKHLIVNLSLKKLQFSAIAASKMMSDQVSCIIFSVNMKHFYTVFLQKSHLLYELFSTIIGFDLAEQEQLALAGETLLH